MVFSLCLGIGNPRGNENPMLLSMQVVWFRNHNYITNRLLNVFEGLGVEVNDEILYNRARQWNIAEYQVGSTHLFTLSMDHVSSDQCCSAQCKLSSGSSVQYPLYKSCTSSVYKNFMTFFNRVFEQEPAQRTAPKAVIDNLHSCRGKFG